MDEAVRRLRGRVAIVLRARRDRHRRGSSTWPDGTSCRSGLASSRPTSQRRARFSSGTHRTVVRTRSSSSPGRSRSCSSCGSDEPSRTARCSRLRARVRARAAHALLRRLSRRSGAPVAAPREPHTTTAVAARRRTRHRGARPRSSRQRTTRQRELDLGGAAVTSRARGRPGAPGGASGAVGASDDPAGRPASRRRASHPRVEGEPR